MSQISIQIPDKNFSFMMELMQKFDFVTIDTPNVGKPLILSEKQKSSVDSERYKANNDSNYILNWDTAKDTLMID